VESHQMRENVIKSSYLDSISFISIVSVLHLFISIGIKSQRITG
jgi:hypothetical protein